MTHPAFATRLAALAVLLALYQPAARADGDPIDNAENDCHRQAQYVVEDTACVNKAYADWDAALNREYVSLMREMTSAQKEALRESQRQWVTYRDTYFAAMETVYAGKEGQTLPLLWAQAQVALVKTRVSELRHLQEVLNR
jgi:uncharacterized protein YecT (DUF1311 family)